MSRVIVTGAGGFIGGRLLLALQNEPAEVIAIDRALDRVPANCRPVVADLTRPGALDPYLTEGATVYHLAAHADVAMSVRDPLQDFAINVRGLLEVLEAARKARCRLLFPSSAAVFDPGNPLPLIERAFVRPSSPYGAAKAAGEAYCAAYHRCYGLDVRVARMFNVYGPGMRRFAIYDLIQKVRKDPEQITVLGDGNQLRDYLYIDDALAGMRRIMSHGQPGEDYNLGAGVPTRSADLAARIAALLGHPRTRVVPTGQSFPGDVPRWYADIGKIRGLGFAPATSLEDGLRATIAWVLAQ